jgi:hypothetical protein
MSINLLEKHYSLDIDLNTDFEGSYKLLKYIVEKYKIYNAQITKFVTDNNYGISATSSWRKKDVVPNRVWNLIHKDLIMLRLAGKIPEEDIMTLEELQDEFNFLSHS